MQALHRRPQWENPLDQIEADTEIQADGRVIGRFKHFSLHSHYQPIFSFAHRRVVGYEALVRPRLDNGDAVPPNLLFEGADHDDDIVRLDRLCRDIHVRNFAAMGAPPKWLFLNVNARVALGAKRYGAYFAALLERYRLPPHRVVIEILENDIQDPDLLAETVRYYADLGCLIAIDDFGAGHSNFERIWRIAPHIVKLDRSMLIQAREKSTVRRVLPSLVALLHETGCLTLIEGVETEEESFIAMDSGIDFVQGFFFARPQPTLFDESGCTGALGELCVRFRSRAKDSSADKNARLRHYLQAFRQCADLIEIGTDLQLACEQMLALPSVLRCFMLDANGRQIGDNLLPSHASSAPDRRFEPVSTASDAIWARRHYFLRAMDEPGKVHVSRPYLSVSDAKMCITLSIRLSTRSQQPQVFCADILADRI